jgi:hypothetical protein
VFVGVLADCVAMSVLVLLCVKLELWVLVAGAGMSWLSKMYFAYPSILEATL